MTNCKRNHFCGNSETAIETNPKPTNKQQESIPKPETPPQESPLRKFWSIEQSFECSWTDAETLIGLCRVVGPGGPIAYHTYIKNKCHTRLKKENQTSQNPDVQNIAFRMNFIQKIS